MFMIHKHDHNQVTSPTSWVLLAHSYFGPAQSLEHGSIKLLNMVPLGSSGLRRRDEVSAPVGHRKLLWPQMAIPHFHKLVHRPDAASFPGRSGLGSSITTDISGVLEVSTSNIAQQMGPAPSLLLSAFPGVGFPGLRIDRVSVLMPPFRPSPGHSSLP